MHKVLTNKPDNSWLTHTRGCAELVKLRGPLRHLTEFDKVLLHGEEGLIVRIISASPNSIFNYVIQASDALIKQKSCFSNTTSLREALHAHGLAKDTKTIYLILYHEPMASLPDLLRAGSKFKEREDFPSQKVQLRPLLVDSKRQRGDFRQLIAFIAPEKELSSLSVPMDSWNSKEMSFMLCKNAFSLVAVDTALLACYICLAVFLCPELCAQQELMPSPDFLEVEIEKCYQLEQRNFKVAIEVTPLNTRPLVYVFRAVCEKIKNQEGIIRYGIDWRH
jgi:hypothetical protein